MSNNHKGTFVFSVAEEGEGESLRRIFFNPPLRINFNICEKIDTETGKENFSQDVKLMAFTTFDFGMDVEYPLDVEHNWLANGYEGLTTESHPIDVLMKTIFFDLFHSFFHPIQDPNYSHYNWALQGWLQERATVESSE